MNLNKQKVAGVGNLRRFPLMLLTLKELVIDKFAKSAISVSVMTLFYT